ncbi:MAG: response regulator [Candidatus Aminicenantes bacterium]|nr:response regulator [Candidatus Aminicenantes bacterium]
MRILIVDDQEANRYLLKTLLAGSGHETAEAVNGKAALDLLEAGPFDLVISDILMPAMDGYQLCREIRGRERFRGLPFVFLTATYIEEKDEAFALKLGADAFYRKPFDPRTFMGEIERLMNEIQGGKQRPAGIEVNEKEILTLYNERLVHKLEAKMMRLEVEIAEREKVEASLRKSVREKEVLIREIHHRVKNNMQIISSLINLSSRDIEDPATLDVLRQIKLRIRSMSMIHEKLLKSENLDRIDFKEFLQDLAIHLFQFFRVEASLVGLKIEAEEVCLPLEAAVPCGLIAGEALSNALKHAFPEERRGEIVVTLKRLTPDEIVLSVCDDGVGLPADVEIASAESMGLTIINSLVEQLDGRLEHLPGPAGGSEFRVTFKSPAC